MRLWHRIGLVCALLATAGLGWGLRVLASSPPGRPAPAVLDCFMGPPQTRPPRLILACGDGNIVAVGIIWARWGPQGAYGHGLETWNTCVPDCARSKTWGSTSAQFALSDPARTRYGWLFSTVTVTDTGHVAGQPGDETFSMTMTEAPSTQLLAP